MSLSKDIQGMETLISEKELQDRCKKLGSEISRHYRDSEDLVVIGVLKGVFPFFADLVRCIDLSCRCDFIWVSSYGSRTKTSGVVRLTSDLSEPINGCDVLLVEDIVDTGLTMQYLLEMMRVKKAKTVEICSLLSKPDKRKVPVTIMFPGFEIEDHFVIGYGLDYKQRHRNLREVKYFPEGPPTS